MMLKPSQLLDKHNNLYNKFVLNIREIRYKIVVEVGFYKKVKNIFEVFVRKCGIFRVDDQWSVPCRGNRNLFIIAHSFLTRINY